MNNIYEKFSQIKNSNNNNNLIDESNDYIDIHNFNSNFKPITNNNKAYNYSNNNNHTEVSEYNQPKYKHNPVNDINNEEDSLIKDLTKFRKFALNEINQSE
jgi:hypothetical protein